MTLPSHLRGKGIRWEIKQEFYDIEDGTQIKKDTANDKNKYIKIKTETHYETNINQTKGIIRYTTQCKRQPQLRIF